MDAGNENDRRLLKPRMLADHLARSKPSISGILTSIEHDGDVHLEEILQGLPAGSGLDQISVKLAEYDLIAE